MAESSQPSTPAGKRRTTKTEPLTPEQVLEILATALRECQQSGIKLVVDTLYHAGSQNTMIVLERVAFVDGSFVLADDGKAAE